MTAASTSGGAEPPARDIPSLLGSFAAYGERRALSFYRGRTLDGRLSYSELVTRVDALAAFLARDRGLTIGERVAILAPNRLEIPVLVLALLRLGAVVVPLNPTASPEDWAYILRHSEARGVCASRDLLAKLPESPRTDFVLEVESTFGHADAAPASIAPAEPLAEHLGVILYTSGTTGDPKGVALRQRGLICNAWSMARNFRLDATCQLAVLPLYHAHAFGFGLMTALSSGGHLVFTERLEPLTWAHVVRAESAEVASVVPTMLPMLVAAGVRRDAMPSLRHLMVSSAPLTPALARDFEARTGMPITLGWGLSEYTNFACCVSPDESDEDHQRSLYAEEVPSVGPALEGTEVRVIGAGGHDAREGEQGELVVRGHSRMAGYFRDPENSARAIDPDGWLHTGDEGFFRLRGDRPFFFVTGRLKEIIIRDAEKFSPLRIERRLVEAVPSLAGKLVVLGFPHPVHGEEVGAYVECHSLPGGWTESLHAELSTAALALPVAERPKVILHGSRAVARTHTGKVQRRKMQPWFEGFRNHRGATVFAELPDSA